MQRVSTGFKETYKQVGEYEYDRINPYAEMLLNIRANYPNAIIYKCYTTTFNFGSLQVPLLTMHYETGIPA
jgi:2-iminoacetate synthase ThiH